MDNTIAQFFRQLNMGRTSVAALALGTAGALFLPRVFPGYLPPVDPRWAWGFMAVFVLCAAILVVWAAIAIRDLVVWLNGWRIVTFDREVYSALEQVLMLLMAARPHGSLPLDVVSNANWSRLEILLAAKGLAKRRLVTVHHNSSATLTELGQRRAFALQAKQADWRRLEASQDR